MQVRVDRANRQRQLEATARAAAEGRVERKLTESEWAAMRAKLVEFAAILRGWEHAMSGPRRGKVEVICHREL
jgi:hypothetical protein